MIDSGPSLACRAPVSLVSLITVAVHETAVQLVLFASVGSGNSACNVEERLEE